MRHTHSEPGNSTALTQRLLFALPCSRFRAYRAAARRRRWCPRSSARSSATYRALPRGWRARLTSCGRSPAGFTPSILSEGGLGPALRSLRRRSAVPIELDLHAERRLPERVEVAAYYVVSEALTNAAKHAHASVVKVELDAHDAILQLAIRDDGIGGADPSRGSGLVGLSDRIEALGGTLEVTSPTGSGTTLLIELPVEG